MQNKKKWRETTMIKIIDYTKNPLTKMGTVASACWNSKPSAKIGVSCIESGHGRVLEFADITVEIQDYSARMLRELYTSSVGCSKLQSSTRYINYGEFEYYVPDSVEDDDEAYEIYTDLMSEISKSYTKLQDLNIPKQDIANILPLGMISTVVLKINARALLHMAEIRLCTRALKEFREFMRELIGEISKLNDEWAKIMSYAKPKCDVHGYCNEHHSCGKYPKRKETNNND